MTTDEHINALLDDAERLGYQDRMFLLIADRRGIQIRLCALPGCKKPFVPKRADHTYCSGLHRSEHYHKFLVP